MKLDRDRAALVVVDVQEAFRKAVPSFERGRRGGREAGPAARRRWGSRSSSPSSTRRGSGATVPEVAEHLPAGSSRWRRSASPPPRPRASTSAAATRRSSAGSRPTSASTRRCSTCSTRCRGARRQRRGRLAHGGEPRAGLHKAEQAGAVLTSVETALFELLRRLRRARVQAGAGVGQVSRAAYVLLEDGTRFDGEVCGARTAVTGEVVFNTAMTGYQEAVTDPSYAGQIITFTYPLIGNYGVSGDGDGVRPGPRPGGDHARRQERRGRRHRRGRLARLARRLRRAGDQRRRHAGAGPPHPRPGSDAGRRLPAPTSPRPRPRRRSRPSPRWPAPTWPAR